MKVPHPELLEAVAIGVPDEKWGGGPTAGVRVNGSCADRVLPRAADALQVSPFRGFHE